MGLQRLHLDFICRVHSLCIKWTACVKLHACWKRTPAIAVYFFVVLTWTHKMKYVVESDKSHTGCFSGKCAEHLAVFSNWNGISEHNFAMKNVSTFSCLQFNLFNVSLSCRMLRFQICITTQTDVLEDIFIHQEYFQPPYINCHNLKFMAPEALCLTRGYYTHCSWNVLLYYARYKGLISLWWCIGFP